MQDVTAIKKSESEAILRSLAAGVTPTTGLHHIAVGRAREIEQLLAELESTMRGGSGCKFIAGPYGNGKTFLLNLMGYMASRRNFVVCQADMSPARHLYGGGKGVALFQALMASMSTKLDQPGQAPGKMLDRWLAKAIKTDGPLDKKVQSLAEEIEQYQCGYDFATVLSRYCEAYLDQNRERQRQALMWFKGEMTSKADAKATLGVRSVVDDSNWSSHLRIWAKLISAVGYSGLLVMLDECANLLKVTHHQTRSANYEVLLSWVNDTLQGRLGNIYFLFGATTEFVTDSRRGLASYEALRSRLVPNPHTLGWVRDMTQPVMELPRLEPEELVVLLLRVRDIHSLHYEYKPYLSDVDVTRWVEGFLHRLGSKDFSTIRDSVRSFIGCLEVVRQNPNLSAKDVFAGNAVEVEPSLCDPFEEFSSI